MMTPDFLVNYRTGISSSNEKNIINSRAWVQTAINFSQKIETKVYNAERLKSFLPELRSMTCQEPEIFFPKMIQIFAECGVAFVLLPNLKNSGVNGSVKWINEERVVLAMNNRRLDEADVFATNYLIPPAALRKFAPSKYTTDNDIIDFAKSIGIHPGIVAGRLQHEGILAPDRCSKLKEKYHIVIDKFV